MSTTGQDALFVTIQGQDSGAGDMMLSVIAKLDQIEAELARMAETGAAAGEAVAKGAAVATEGVNAESGAVTGLGAAMEQATAHGATLARGLGALGLEAEAGVARVEALTGALEEMSAAVPELLAIGAAMVAVVESFNFVKESIVLAADFDQSLAILGQTVKNQGANWDELREKVLAFAEEQERFTKFSRDEVISALTDLTRTGMSLADAMTSVRVAEDAAQASGKSLHDITQGLLQAEMGRTRILAELGVATRAQIHDGMSYDAVLEAIEQHMGGVAETAGNTLPGALAQLHNSFESMEEDLGEKLQPGLIAFVQSIRTVIPALEDELMPAFDALGQWFTDNGPTIAHALEEIVKTATDFGHELNAEVLPPLKDLTNDLLELIGQVLGVNQSVGDGHDTWEQFRADLDAIVQVTGDVLQGFDDLVSQGNSDWPEMEKQIEPVIRAVVALETALDKVAEAFSTLMGDAQAAQSWHAAADAAADFVVNGYNQVGSTSGGAWGGGDTGIGKGSGGSWAPGRVNTHTTFNPEIGGKQGGAGGAGFNAQETQAATLDTNALAAAHNALATSLKDSAAAETALHAAIDPTLDSTKQNAEAVTKLYAAYEAARAQIPQLVADLAQEKTAEQNAQQAVQLVHQEYEHAVTALNDYSKSLEGKQKVSADEKRELEELKGRVKDLSEAYRIEDTNLKAVTKSLSDHEKQLAADTKAINEFKDAQQKIIIGLNDEREQNAQRLADDEATYGKSLQDEMQYWQYRLDIARQKSQDYFNLHHANNEKLVKDQEDAETKVNDLEIQAWNQRIDEQKKAQQQVQGEISKFLDDVITQHKSFKDAFQSIWDDIVKIFIEDIAKMIAESSLFKAIFGNMSSTPSFGGSVGAGGIDTIGSLIGIPGSPSNSGLNVNVVGSALSGITGGAGSGSVGSIGLAIGAEWALGSAIGSAFGDAPGNHNSSIGAIIGGLPGAIIGALFGPKTNAHDNPDIYNPGSIGQAMANFSGISWNNIGSPGNNYQPQLSQFGGQSEENYIANYIKNNPNNPAGLTQQELQYFTGGANSPVDYEKNGNIQFNGQLIYWQDLANAAADAASKIQGLGTAASGATGPIVTITRTYPDFNIAQNGTTPPPGTGGSNDPTAPRKGDPPHLAPPGSNPVGPIGPPGDPGGKPSPIGKVQPLVHVDMSGAMIVGPGGLADVANVVSQAIQQTSTGQLPGGYLNTIASRLNNKGS